MHKKKLTARKKAELEKKRKQKIIKTVCILVLAAVLLAAGTFLIVRNYDAIRARIENSGRTLLTPVDEETLLDKKSGTYYRLAPPQYEPAEKGEARAWSPALDDRVFYAIGDADPALWLAEEYAATGTRVYYNQSIELPTLEELHPDRIRVIDTSHVIASEVAVVTDEALIAEALDLFFTAEDKQHPFEWDFRLDLKLCSSEWPEIVYNLTYYDTEEGAYLMDRKSLRSVFLGTLLRDAINYQ